MFLTFPEVLERLQFQHTKKIITFAEFVRNVMGAYEFTIKKPGIVLGTTPGLELNNGNHNPTAGL